MVDLRGMIRVIPDFPKPGVSFKDITPILKDAAAFKDAIDTLAGALKDVDFDLIVSPEARGFMFGAALAYRMGKGFVPVRKAGKLPFECVQGTYNLEYGVDTLQMHKDAVRPGQKVVVLDDVLATGGTVSAVANLVEQVGGQVQAVAFLIELAYIPGRRNLTRYSVVSAISLES
jgi:adenine phosphoribosyltransferase